MGAFGPGPLVNNQVGTGIEPATFWSPVRRSTIELPGLRWQRKGYDVYRFVRETYVVHDMTLLNKFYQHILSTNGELTLTLTKK